MAGKSNPQIRREQAIKQWRELVLLRGLEVQGHIVHRAFGRHHPRETTRIFFLRGEERVRIDHLVGVREGKIPSILSEQIMQVRGAATPVAEDEDGRLSDFRPLHFFPEIFPLPPSAPGIENAEQRDHRGPVQVGCVHLPAVLTQQSQPVTRGDSGEVVVGNAPPMFRTGFQLPRIFFSASGNLVNCLRLNCGLPFGMLIADSIGATGASYGKQCG